MTKETVICPKCGVPIGEYPKVRYLSVRVPCFSCLSILIVNRNRAVGGPKTPEVLSLEEKHIDDIAHYDPTERLNDDIDRQILLKKLEPVDKKICNMLYQGYTYEEIGKELGTTKQSVHSKLKTIRKRLKKKT